jgi:anhydro-N-acetylmuramic acid kinase
VGFVIALGVMSGTSADGVDAVMIELESVVRRHEPRVLGHAHRVFPARLRADLVRAGELGVGRVV